MVSGEVERIANVLRKHLPDAKIVLFGSRARGDELRDSDIDLIVVSQAFEGMSFTDRASYILRILWNQNALPRVDIDILCYTPREFKKKKNEISIVKEALRYGVTL